jgi:putative addiction module component (TIGR02574 family)
MKTIDLAEEIRDGIAADTEPLPLTAGERSEIARRIAEHARDPSSAILWGDALAILRERYG